MLKFFEQCSNMTNDDFWKTLFIDASRNKMSRGYFLNNNKIIYRNGNKIHYCDIPKSPKTAYETLMAFFQNIGCMNSEKDIEKNKQEEENLSKTKKITKWNDIKKKNKKDYFIEKFIAKKIQKHIVELDVVLANVVKATVKVITDASVVWPCAPTAKKLQQ